MNLAPREGREIYSRRRMEPARFINVTHSGNKTVTLARNRLHENRLLRRITERLPQLVHSSVHVGIVVDMRVRRPELQAQLFTGHDFSGLLKQGDERLINFALQLNT